MLRTDPSVAECLSIGNGSFTMLGVLTINLKVLVCVCWIHTQVGLK